MNKRPTFWCHLGFHTNLGVYGDSTKKQLQLELEMPYHDGCGRAHRRIYWRCWHCDKKIYVGKTIDILTSEDTYFTRQEIWRAMDGNPGIKPSREDILDGIKVMTEAVDHCDENHRDQEHPKVVL